MPLHAYRTSANDDAGLTGQRLSASEYWLLLHTSANVLVIADDDDSQELVVFLEKRLPRVAVHPATTLHLEDDGAATVIVRDVAGLTCHDQAALMTRLEEAPGMRVISITGRSVMPLVEAGQFLGALYYRLNTLLIDLRDRRPLPAHGKPSLVIRGSA